MRTGVLAYLALLPFPRAHSSASQLMTLTITPSLTSTLAYQV